MSQLSSRANSRRDEIRRRRTEHGRFGRYAHDRGHLYLPGLRGGGPLLQVVTTATSTKTVLLIVDDTASR